MDKKRKKKKKVHFWQDAPPTPPLQSSTLTGRRGLMWGDSLVKQAPCKSMFSGFKHQEETSESSCFLTTGSSGSSHWDPAPAWASRPWKGRNKPPPERFLCSQSYPSGSGEGRTFQATGAGECVFLKQDAPNTSEPRASRIIETLGTNGRRGWSGGGGERGPFSCHCWKSSSCGFGETHSPVFGFGPEWGGMGKCSVPSTFGVGRQLMAQPGESGEEFLNTCDFKTWSFAARHPEAPASSACCEFVYLQISWLSTATGTSTEILNK